MNDGNILGIGEKNVLFAGSGEVLRVLPHTPYVNRIAVFNGGKYVTMERRQSVNSDYGVYLNSGGHRLIGSSSTINGLDVAVQPDDKILILNSIGTNVIIKRLQAVTSRGTRMADYDNDEKTDVAVYRPSDSTLYVANSNGGIGIYGEGQPISHFQHLMPERYGGSLAGSPFVYWRLATEQGVQAAFCGAGVQVPGQCVIWGQIGDKPVGGDYDGDGLTDVSVFRPADGIWYIRRSSDNEFSFEQWGTNGDKPVPADFDYDGLTDIAIYRPSSGEWWIKRSSDQSHFAIQFGIAADIPLTGDFDGDGYADLTVYRPSEGMWYQLLTSSGLRATQFGISTDSPVPGDYDGDGRHDIAVFRDGIWYLLQSTHGFSVIYWGTAGDIPAAIRYDQ